MGGKEANQTKSLFCPLQVDQGDTVGTNGQDLDDLMNQLKGL